MITYCANDPCENPATEYYINDYSVPVALCPVCAHAYELGRLYNKILNALPVESADQAPPTHPCVECGEPAVVYDWGDWYCDKCN